MLNLWTVPPFSDTPVLPDTLPGDALDTSIALCRGEVGSLSLCVRSDHPARLLPRAWRYPGLPVVQSRYVLRWIQNRNPSYGKKDPGLVPEPLTHDPELIRVVDGKNVTKQPFADASDTLPIDLPPNYTQQLWLTVRAEDVAPGIHHVPFSWGMGDARGVVWITVEVLPTSLLPSPITYSIYHKAELEGGTNYKTERQYRAELANMLDHGVTAPMVWQDCLNPFRDRPSMKPDRLGRVLAMRKELGVADSPLILARMGVAFVSESFPADELIRVCRRAKQFCADRGFHNVYTLGPDQCTGHRMLADKALWARLKAETGIKLACSFSNRSHLGLVNLDKEMDLPLFNCVDRTKPYEGIDTAAWHARGLQVGHYGPSMYEWPAYHRWRYGLGALQAGFDWVVPYCYEWREGASHIDDLDAPYKDEDYVIPTEDGVLDTRQWEALRQATQDVRDPRG